MPFFIRKNTQKNKNNGVKRKKGVKPHVAANSRKKQQEEVTSDEEPSGGEEETGQFSSEEETFQEKRLRLTKKYIAEISKKENETGDLEDVSKDAIAQRLREDALEEEGRLQKKRADEYRESTPEVLKIFRGHKLSITCLVISSDENYVFSASKDYSIIKWSIKDEKKMKTIPRVLNKDPEKNEHPGHSADILSMAISSDDKFLATGCRNNIINIWNPDTMEHLKIFRGHKAAITGLTFSRGSHQLISASSDRSLKVWNLDEMGYVETLFGHQDGITSIDSFLSETAITAGGRDSTVRIWKIAEESQLVYRGHGASIDNVCVTSKDNFVSGADDGSLCLWGVRKKKPLFKITESHGHDPETEEPFWITSLCSLQNTDVLASGSQDGVIRLWMRDDVTHKILPINNIPVEGFVNSLKFSSSGKYLVAGIGQEHRFGRWWRRKEAKNSVVIYS